MRGPIRVLAASAVVAPLLVLGAGAASADTGSNEGGGNNTIIGDITVIEDLSLDVLGGGLFGGGLFSGGLFGD